MRLHPSWILLTTKTKHTRIVAMNAQSCNCCATEGKLILACWQQFLLSDPLLPRARGGCIDLGWASTLFSIARQGCKAAWHSIYSRQAQHAEQLLVPKSHL